MGLFNKKSVPDENPRQHISCAHTSCQASAILTRPTKEGPANVCRQHYEYFHQEVANRYASSLNLTDTEVKIAWCRERSGHIGSGAPRHDLVVMRWESILGDQKASPIARAMACEALGRIASYDAVAAPAVVERAPGEDDE